MIIVPIVLLFQEEINRLKEQIEEMIVEHNNVVLERNGLQQQCTQAVHKWDITLRERKELQDALKKVYFETRTVLLFQGFQFCLLITFGCVRRCNNNSKKQ